MNRKSAHSVAARMEAIVSRVGEWMMGSKPESFTQLRGALVKHQPPKHRHEGRPRDDHRQAAYHRRRGGRRSESERPEAESEAEAAVHDQPDEGHDRQRAGLTEQLGVTARLSAAADD